MYTRTPKIARRASNSKVFPHTDSSPCRKSIFSQLPDRTFPSLLNAQTVWVWNLGTSSVPTFPGTRGTPKQVHIPSRPVLTPPRGVKIRIHDTISGRAHRRAALRVDVSQTNSQTQRGLGNFPIGCRLVLIIFSCIGHGRGLEMRHPGRVPRGIGKRIRVGVWHGEQGNLEIAVAWTVGRRNRIAILGTEIPAVGQNNRGTRRVVPIESPALRRPCSQN